MKVMWLLVVPIIVLLVFSNLSSNPNPAIQNAPNWHESYSAEVSGISREYLKETYYFDYSSPEVQQAIQEILLNSGSAEEAVQNTLDYVYFNVNYVYNEDDDICFSSTASDVLKRQSGQCDTMSRLTIAILRGMGIPARSEVGCLAIDAGCFQSFSVLKIPLPKYVEITDEELLQDTVSRKGGLHSWSEAYIPSLGGWVDLESTNGRIVEADTCMNYVTEMYASTVVEECVSRDNEFIQMCKNL